MLKYLNSLPGTIIHIVFDNYQYEYETPSKNRDSSECERIICDLDQELPITCEWKSFLSNDKNKYQLINLLVRFILESGLVHSKNIFVNNGNECYYKGIHEETKLSEELSSLHKEADPKISMHAVYACRLDNKPVCVVADDTDVFILLLFVARYFEGNVFFRKVKYSDKEGITYHDIISLADHLGEEICDILPCFHTLTGSDYTNPFIGRTKIQSFKRMISSPSSIFLLTSMKSQDVDISAVTKFVLQVIYNRPKKEKTPGESRYQMLFTGKGSKKKFSSTKSIPPDQSSMKMKMLRSTFVSHTMVNTA